MTVLALAVGAGFLVYGLCAGAALAVDLVGRG